ncbi:MAG: hypothetical protein ABSC63_09205 [Candidatus Binataceae bacterium]
MSEFEMRGGLVSLRGVYDKVSLGVKVPGRRLDRFEARIGSLNTKARSNGLLDFGPSHRIRNAFGSLEYWRSPVFFAIPLRLQWLAVSSMPFRKGSVKEINSRRIHKVPTHKRERGRVAELHSLTLAQVSELGQYQARRLG